MTHKKNRKVQKTHPIDQEHSKKGAKPGDAFGSNVATEDHSINLSKHVNPHAAFGARTTLSKGRGK